MAASPLDGSSSDVASRALDQFIRGTVADEMGDHYRAVFHYQEALRSDSSSAFIQVALAQDYALLGNASLALETLDRALKVTSDYVPALELKVVMLRGLGRLKEARNTLLHLVDLAPTDVEHLRQLLSLDLALGEFEDADREYGRIIKETGESDMLSRQVLSVCLTAGQTDRAIVILKRLLVRDSTDTALIYTLGTAALQKGDTAAAESLMTRAISLRPSEPRFWTGLAVIAMDRQRYERAVALVDSALANSGPQAGLLSMKGSALNRLGRTGEAMEVFHAAIALDSTQFVAMGMLALIYDGMDSLDQAVEWYERAIAQSDSAPVYLNNLAYTWASRGLELEKARTLVTRALEAEPNNGAYLDTMGWVEYGLGHYDEALHWLKRAADVNAGAAVLEHVGDTYLKLGSPKKAAKYYRRAIRLDPTNETLKKKLGD